MKIIVFICLLSLSTCFGATTGEQGTPAQTQGSNVPLADTKTPQPHPQTLDPSTVHTNIQKTSTENNITPVSAQSSTPPENVAPSTQMSDTKQPDANTNKTPTNANVPATNDNKTDNKTIPEEKKVEPPKDDTKTTNTKGNPENKPDVNNGTKPEDNEEKKNGTSPHNDVTTTKPTEAPKTDGDKHIVQARSFDGPSFIGGIVLTIGLLAVGFVGFKYYMKSRTEGLYRSF